MAAKVEKKSKQSNFYKIYSQNREKFLPSGIGIHYLCAVFKTKKSWQINNIKEVQN
jgi:hypothetical protein